MGTFNTLAVLASGISPDVDAMDGINGSKIITWLLGILLIVVVVVAIKELMKSDRVKIRDTMEYAGNNAIVFLVLVLALGGFFWAMATGVIGSVTG